MRFRLIFGPYGPRVGLFMGHFVTFPSRQLLAQTEAGITYFVTLAAPFPRTDHSLRHSTTRVGLRARRVRILFFRGNARFGRFSWAIAHGLRHPGQFFGNLLDCHKILVDDILWGFHWFLDHRAHIPGLLRVISLPFSSRQLLAQTEAGMTYFVTLTVPSPRTDHSLRHSTTMVGLRDRLDRILFFRENVRFGRFSWAIAHGFWHPGQFFGNLPDCHKILVDDILWGFDWFSDHRAHIPGLLRVISLPFLTDTYMLKQKPEWHISSL
jgi:hypothetical protein